jgi:hypothetical protein
METGNFCQESSGTERTIRSQSTSDRLASDRSFSTADCRMHPGASAGKCCGNIHNGLAISCNHPHEEGSVSTFAAAKTGSNEVHLIPFCTGVTKRAIPRAVRVDVLPDVCGQRRQARQAPVTAAARKAELQCPPRGAERCQSSSRIESGWISMRAPVSLAARRAFWPSLPMASESW